MTTVGSNGPAWLFSFVDLAFLLLIAMTQLGDQTQRPDLGEVLVPRLHAEASAELPADAAIRWQLRVHPPDPEAPDRPFELVEARGNEIAEASERIDLAALRARLAQLGAASVARPLLAPHRDSRSEDLLEAAGLLEERWPDRRRATILPLVARR